jgi:hypothetical protein
MSKRAIQQRLVPGQRVQVTNHYINRPDHPCYGTTERTIARNTTSHLWFTESGNVPWPTADRLTIEGDTIRLYGGGAGQQPEELFLTLTLRGD